MAIGPMVPLTTAASSFAARVLAAHLGAEGIVWELRGNVDGPYPVGPVEVLVAEGDLALAREVVAEQRATAPDAAGGTADGGGAVSDAPGGSDAARDRARGLWLVLALVLLAAALLLGRLLESTWAEGSAQPPASPLPASGASGVGVAVSSAGAGTSAASA